MGVVDDGVAPLTKVVVRDRDLVGDTIDGIRQILDEVAYHVLPHPLLGRQSHEGLADTVEDLVLVVFFSNFELKIRQIHRCGFFIRKNNRPKGDTKVSNLWQRKKAKSILIQ